MSDPTPGMPYYLIRLTEKPIAIVHGKELKEGLGPFVTAEEASAAAKAEGMSTWLLLRAEGTIEINLTMSVY